MNAPKNAPPLASSLFCVAPMLDWTDKHCRVFHRLLTRRSLLYSEMISTGAILHGDRERHLGLAGEHPVALQLGGNAAADLAECARIGEEYGYNEINLNCGCPSDRVSSGRFGACLMATPDIVARAVEAMQKATSLPVTVKHRIGIDDLDRYEDLHHFVSVIGNAGCKTFIVHARKAWLNGLSPKENREIPPLKPEWVAQLAADFPHLQFILNGGLQSIEQCNEALTWADGVMVGRAAYADPFLLARVDRDLFGEQEPPLTRREVIEGYLPYVQSQLEEGQPLHRMMRHTLGLFAGKAGARHYKRILSEQTRGNLDTIKEALAGIPAEVLDERP